MGLGRLLNSNAFDRVEAREFPVARGRLTQQARKLSPAERWAVEPWLADGHDVEAVAPATVSGIKSPDVMVDGAAWEIKTPSAAADHTIPDNIRHARKQAPRVLVDVRQTALTEQQGADGLAQALRKYGSDLEQILIFGAGFELRWERED